MKFILRPLAFFALALAPASAGVFSLSAPFTDDPSSLIDPLNDYTHAISGGTVANVNGVNFEQLSPGIIPAGFSWQSSTFGFSEVIDNNGQWSPAAGGVTGAGLIDLLESFTYSGNGAQAGNSQTFTLSGLTPGITYDTRLYQRVWDVGTSGRPIDLTFTNGAEVDVYPGLEQDRPGNVLGTGNQHEAYFLSYAFTAQGTDLVINTAVPPNAVFNSGSYHMYALTNQVIPEPAAAASLALAIALFGMARRRR
ncbi:MAG: PEP-CTERM sorting domain-containing protein [Verrucomicrobiales bacterium]